MWAILLGCILGEQHRNNRKEEDEAGEGGSGRGGEGQGITLSQSHNEIL